jgi:hypothetical protein
MEASAEASAIEDDRGDNYYCVGVRKKNLTLPRKAVDTYENII